LHLATKELDTALPPAGVYWRNLARRYLTELCHTPDFATAASLAPPPDEELAKLAESAPPTPGAEYLRVGTLQSLWQALDALVLGEVVPVRGAPRPGSRRAIPFGTSSAG
jgi:non-specific serine/threonine protein kinase